MLCHEYGHPGSNINEIYIYNKMDNDKVELTEVCRVCANKIKDKKRQRHIFNYLRGKLLQNLKLITGVEVSRLNKQIFTQFSNVIL